MKRMFIFFFVVLLMLCFVSCNNSLPVKCNSCGINNAYDAKFCSNCGELVASNSNAENERNECQHDYKEKVIVEATCTTEGVKVFTCSVATCQHSYAETYPLATYTATEIYEQSVKYVGEIITYDKKGAEVALGTGFVISSDGKILTNYHVIEGAYSADITINNTKYRISSVLAWDAKIDLAVLKIDASNLICATICMQPVDVGSVVYAIGSSRGMTNTYTQGMITYADRIVDGISYVQHDASITHGNSGGPLINVYGEVIGVNTWGISDSQNLNFAVFIDELDNLVYGTSLSLEDLTEENLSPFQLLVEWVFDNATDIYDNSIENSKEWENNDWFTISYDFDKQSVTFSHLNIGEKSTVWSALTLKEDTSLADCGLISEWNSTGVKTGEAYGRLNIATYNYGDTVPYTHYFGESFMEKTTGDLYDISIVGVIERIRIFLSGSDLDITLIDLGFVSYEYP